MSTAVVKYHPNIPHEAYELALLGLTDVEIARVWGVTEQTISLWKRTKPELAEQMNKGRMQADREVVKAFFNTCVGFTYEEEEVHVVQGQLQTVKVKRYKPGDKWAQARWLAVRQRGAWTESQRVEISRTNTNINIDLSGLDMKELLLAKKLGIQSLLPSEDIESVPLADDVDENKVA